MRIVFKQCQTTHYTVEQRKKQCKHRKIDTLGQLAYVFEEFRRVCMNIMDFNGVYAYYGVCGGVLRCQKCKHRNLHKCLVLEGEPLGI